MELNIPLFAFTWVEFKNVELFHIWAVLKQFMKLRFIYMAPKYNSYLKVL